MRLDKLPPVGHFERSQDEILSQSITAYFLGRCEFPNNQAEISILGHETMPPTVYDLAWKLEPSENWFAHRLGTIYHDVNAKGEFVSAGAAAILVTDRHVRLMVGAGVYNKSLAVRGSRSEGTHLEKYVFRFIELASIAAGDVLILEHWKLGKFFLKIPWARSLAALISGLRVNAKSPKILENSVITSAQKNRLGSVRTVQILDVQGKV